VKLLVEHGANVVFGDINAAAAHESTTSATFVECDVTRYDDIYQLFKKTHDQFGHIDHAISCAGIFEQGNWFDPNYTIDSIKEDPGNTKVLDVNLTGTLHFARIAAVFLRESRQENSNKSLTLLSSVNAFRDSPGLYLYQTSKHAIQGILRSTRKTLYERDGIRVNAVCPGVTDTPMTAAIIQPFKDAGLFWQPAEAVAKVILGIMSSKEMNGKAFYVEGGDGFEFEDSLYAAQPQWLGEEATRRMRVNTEAVQKVSRDI
jgi:NAD(P)-dependent dehydrogenase (short-subunit alcohol dehydrogenase family)